VCLENPTRSVDRQAKGTRERRDRAIAKPSPWGSEGGGACRGTSTWCTRAPKLITSDGCGSRTGSGRYTNRKVLEAHGATRWVGSELEGRRRYQRKGWASACGHEVGHTGPSGPWMRRILRPTSCPLLCPARCTSSPWLICRVKKVFVDQRYPGERGREEATRPQG
jgi:hypothetical protein